jgi:hypothetical protein
MSFVEQTRDEKNSGTSLQRAVSEYSLADKERASSKDKQQRERNGIFSLNRKAEGNWLQHVSAGRQ